MSTECQSPGAAAPPPNAVETAVREAPEQEAAFFYGLFLRGYTYKELRQDIEVPAEVVAKWQRTGERDPQFRSLADQVISYRRRVLAIFQSLIAAENPSVH